MEYRAEHLLWDLLNYRRSAQVATKAFTSLTHNKNLCPAVRSRCDDLLGAFGKYQEIAYDIQGLTDQGTDVLIRLGASPDSPLVCIQVKSNSEIDQSLIDKLILQWQRSEDHYGPRMLDYYVLLCCDAEKHANRIRAVHAAFAQKRATVIAPELAWTFLRMSRMAVDAIVRSKVGADDAVVRAALQISSDLTPSEAAILLLLSYKTVYDEERAITSSDLLDSDFVRDVYERTPDYDRDWYFLEDGEEDEFGFEPLGIDQENRLARDLDFLEGQFVVQTPSGDWELELSSVEPLVVTLMDGHIRYDYEGKELLTYALQVLVPEQLAVAERQH